MLTRFQNFNIWESGVCLSEKIYFFPQKNFRNPITIFLCFVCKKLNNEICQVQRTDTLNRQSDRQHYACTHTRTNIQCICVKAIAIWFINSYSNSHNINHFFSVNSHAWCNSHSPRVAVSCTNRNPQVYVILSCLVAARTNIFQNSIFFFGFNVQSIKLSLKNLLWWRLEADDWCNSFITSNFICNFERENEKFATLFKSLMVLNMFCNTYSDWLTIGCFSHCHVEFHIDIFI